MLRSVVSLFVVTAMAVAMLFAVDAHAATCTISGTNGADTLNGTAGPDVICGLNGADTINGLGGDDVIDGGKGDDVISGGDGADRVEGGDDDDQIDGGADNDFLYGQRGNDTINGLAGADFLYGSEGADQLSGGDDGDTLSPGKDNDTAAGDAGVDTVDYRDINGGGMSIDLEIQLASGAGNDTLGSIEIAVGSPQADTINAAAAGSELIGREGADTLNGAAGADLIRGDTGDDIINAGGAADTVYAGSGADTINGDDGDDHLVGDNDGDTIHGNAGADTLLGEAGNDSLFGDAGNDVLWPSDGDDGVDGGSEFDTLTYAKSTGPVNVNLTTGVATGAGTDTIAAIEKVYGTPAGDILTGDGLANVLDGGFGNGADTLNGMGGNDDLYGAGGNDILSGGADDDLLLGRDGDDTLNGDAGFDALDGSIGNDTLNGGTEDDVLNGHDGIDGLTGGLGDDALIPGIGNDTMDGGGGNDSATYSPIGTGGIALDLAAGTVTGAGGNDTLTAVENVTGTNTDDTMFGDSGDNGLSGRGGVDTISGRGGADVVLGGLGNDFLHGGVGDTDLVVGEGGTDTCGEFADIQLTCEIQFNVPPTLTVVDNSNSYTENAAPLAVDPTLTLTDDETNTESATITIGTGFESGKDFLSVSGVLPAGVTANYVAPTLTISGPATVAQYETMLRNVRFENTSQDPSVTARTISFSVSDGEETDSGNDVTMAVVRVNDAPVADTDSYSGGIHGVRLRVGTTHADTHEVEQTGNVLQGDTDVDTPVGNLTVTPGTITSAGCAAASPACTNNVIMGTDGTFTYDPPAGQGATDTFVYTLNDNDTGDAGSPAQTHTNTVTVNYSGTRYWFVDDSAPTDGRGVSHNPAQSLARLATGGNLNEEDGANDRIFVYSGTYTSGIDLESGQKLLGQPEGLLDGATQLVAAGGTAPAISASTINAHVVALSTGNELQDLALGSTSGTGASLSGGSIGTATVGNTSINNTAGRAIEITTGGTLNAGFDSVSSSNSSGVGVGLTGLSGTIGLGTGTIQNASGTDFHVSGGAANVTYNGAINDTDGRLVNIDGTTGGSRTFNGAVADITDNDNGSTGVRINSAAGPNSFAGGLKLSTGTADALEINSSTGTTTVPNSTVNTLKSTAGYALRAASSPVNLTFQRIDSSGSGTKSGINLSSVSGGGLTVTGAGSAGTGGTISNKQEAGNDADFFSVDGDDADGGNGIHLTNVTAPVSFSRMQLNDFGGFAVRAHGHSGGFSMIDSTISGTNGNADAVNESSVAFTQLSGAADLTRTNVSGGHEDNIAVYNTSGTVNRFKVSGPATIGANSTTFGNGSVDMFITGGIFNATVENMAMTSTGSFHVGYNLSGTSAGDLVMTGNTLTNSHTNIAAGGGGSTIVAQGSADITYNIANNVIKGAKGAALGVSKADGGFGYNATASGSITGNTIGQAGVVNSSSTQGSGIRVGMSTLGTHTTSIRNNSVYGYANHGIQLEVGGVGTGVTGLGVHDGDLNATVKGNVINTPSLPAGGLAQNGIHVNSGSNGTPDANDAYDLCLDIGGASATDKNNITGSGALGGTEIRVRQRFAADILMPGYLGALADTTAVRNYLEPRQTMTAGSSTANHQGISATNGFGNAGAGCPQP